MPAGADRDGAVLLLYWIPLGAGPGSPVVRWSGQLFERIAARRQGRQRCDLYHAALVVHLGHTRFAIEMAPEWGSGTGEHGAVCRGPVGMRVLGRSRYFRYEVRRWRDGVIPDLAYAAGDARRLSEDELTVRQVLDLVPAFPTATWGRDELGTGDMWNSNSLVAWLLARAGVDMTGVMPPPQGRAPGWQAGLAVAARARS